MRFLISYSSITYLLIIVAIILPSYIFVSDNQSFFVIAKGNKWIKEAKFTNNVPCRAVYMKEFSDPKWFDCIKPFPNSNAKYHCADISSTPPPEKYPETKISAFNFHFPDYKIRWCSVDLPGTTWLFCVCGDDNPTSPPSNNNDDEYKNENDNSSSNNKNNNDEKPNESGNDSNANNSTMLQNSTATDTINSNPITSTPTLSPTKDTSSNTSTNEETNGSLSPTASPVPDKSTTSTPMPSSSLSPSSAPTYSPSVAKDTKGEEQKATSSPTDAKATTKPSESPTFSPTTLSPTYPMLVITSKPTRSPTKPKKSKSPTKSKAIYEENESDKNNKDEDDEQDDDDESYEPQSKRETEVPTTYEENFAAVEGAIENKLALGAAVLLSVTCLSVIFIYRKYSKNDPTRRVLPGERTTYQQPGYSNPNTSSALELTDEWGGDLEELENDLDHMRSSSGNQQSISSKPTTKQGDKYFYSNIKPVNKSHDGDFL